MLGSDMNNYRQELDNNTHFPGLDMNNSGLNNCRQGLDNNNAVCNRSVSDMNQGLRTSVSYKSAASRNSVLCNHFRVAVCNTSELSKQVE